MTSYEYHTLVQFKKIIAAITAQTVQKAESCSTSKSHVVLQDWVFILVFVLHNFRGKDTSRVADEIFTYIQMYCVF